MQKVRKWSAAWVVLAVAFLAQTTVPAKERVGREAEASEARLKRDVTFLASDECEGRGPTTRGIAKAADYIVEQFQRAGLKPGGPDGSWFQPFTIPGAHLKRPATVRLRGPLGQEITLEQGTHFHPMGLSSTGAYKDVQVVFAGYGITGTRGFDYDDYQGIDADGKVVIVLRDTPCVGNRFVSIDGPRRRLHGSLTEKMKNAEKHGALALVFVNDADTAKDGDDLLDFAYTAAARLPRNDKDIVKLPTFHLQRSVLEQMLAGSGAPTLPEIERAIDRDLQPHSVALKGWRVSFDVEVRRDTIGLKNVVAVLEGKGPLADETVVIGAHYDHLGYGGGGSLAGLKKMAIHHGADDNGSGSTAVMELARRFAAQKDRQGRRLVFMCFSGEEMGLLGSAYYCKHPLFPLDKTVTMVNLDMVGRLTAKGPQDGAGKLQVHGTGTSKEFSDLIDRLNKPYGFKLQKSKGGFGPSDHSSFYGQKVPVFFFFTGDHPDYHRPSDIASRINVGGMRKVTDLTEDLVNYLATTAEKPKYVKVEGSGFGPRPRVTLGFRPGDYSGDDGVLVGGVIDGRPAARAGIKEGDVIVAMNGKPIKTMQAYMVFMGGQKKGNTIDVTVLRGGKKMSLKVKLD